MPPLQLPEPGTSFSSLPIASLDPFLGEGKGKIYLRLLGSNGSGKSTFGRALRLSDPEAFNFVGEDGKRLGTVFSTFGWGR
jgi:hypothetical protein